MDFSAPIISVIILLSGFFLLACLSVLTKRGVLCKSNKRGVLLVGHGAQKGKEKQMFEEYGKRRTMAGMGRLIPITRSSEGLDDEDISTQGTDFEHGWTDGQASGVLCIIKKALSEDRSLSLGWP
jgi:hypothetical protein